MPDGLNKYGFVPGTTFTSQAEADASDRRFEDRRYEWEQDDRWDDILLGREAEDDDVPLDRFR